MQTRFVCATFVLFVFTTQWLHVISAYLDYPDYADYEDELEENQNHEWDVLVFTQQWPVTTCYDWSEHEENHACKLPAPNKFWTIHGIWPSKLGTYGPDFCNRNASFDVNQLKEIEDRLKQYWPDLDEHAKSNWLWQHEWLKHGTCAVTLEQLNNEHKYFNQGLKWSDEYSISKMLGSGGIHLDSNSTVVAIHNAIVKALGKSPSIHCVYDHRKELNYLSEIRICFDKQLSLRNCTDVRENTLTSVDYPDGEVLTNCHVDKPVNYPSIVPTPMPYTVKEDHFSVVNIYKLVQFLIWSTL